MYINNINTTSTDYVGNIAYTDGAFDYLITGEGRVTKATDTSHFVYEYHLKDHLGNTRIAFEATSANSLKVVQKADYYPFGLQMKGKYLDNGNKYLYNGKELQDDIILTASLGWYDYGSRFYDPEYRLGWITIDNKAEKYTSVSPYVYALNNPIKFIDPDGNEVRLMNAVDIDNSGHYKYEPGVSSKVNALLSDIVKTDEGRAYIGQYATAGQTIGGYTFKENGKYSDNDLIIQDFSLEKSTYDGALPIGTEGTNITRVNEKKGKVETYIQLMSAYQSKGELGETAAEEMQLHGYNNSKEVDAYRTGGKEALNKIIENNPYGYKDHKAFNTKDKSHEGYSKYLKIKEQLIKINPAYKKFFDEAATKKKSPEDKP